jgi:two-component system sensor histidine kinase/response regulator
MMSPRILLVEDDETNAQLFTLMLEHGGYEVVRARNGLLAIELLAHERVDLVLLDVRMPVVDGPQLLRHLRADARFFQLPVIFMTAMAHEREYGRLWELGASGVMIKPFSRKELLTNLAQATCRSLAFG